jgi:hypothetical protein
VILHAAARVRRAGEQAQGLDRESQSVAFMSAKSTMARSLGVPRIQHLARGKKLAPSCEAFSAPGARAVSGYGPKSRSQEPK